MPGNSNLHDSSRNKQDEFYTNLQLVEDELKHYRSHFQGAGGVGGLLYERRDGAIYIPFQDAFGNIMGYWDTNGVIVAEYTYDAFGKIISQTGSMADVFRHRFSTKYFDTETGFYYYGYRYYFPELRRWLSRDPLEEEGGNNLYVFCMNNTTSTFDSLGLFKWIIGQTKTVYDLGGMGSTPSLVLHSNSNPEKIQPNTTAVTGTEWSIHLGCKCVRGYWYPDSAEGTITPVIHLRSSYQEERYRSSNGRKRLIKGEMDHVNDLLEWARNDGARLVDEWVKEKSHRRSNTKSYCEETYGGYLQSYVASQLAYPTTASAKKWDYKGGPHQW